MTQVRFTIDDSDALNQAAKILSEIADQITVAVDLAPESSRFPNVYKAVRNLREMALTLRNWGTLVESNVIERIMDGKALGWGRDGQAEQH